MIAASPLWTPWSASSLASNRARQRIAGKRSWLRRLIDPLAAYAMGQPLTDPSTGKVMTDSSGKVMLDGGHETCCLYQARDCATSTLQSLYVRKSQFPSFPSTYYFKLSGTCYYVQASDKVACTNTPNVSGETGYASCSACAGGGSACPTGALPATYTVTGWENVIQSYGGYPNGQGFGPSPCLWDGVLSGGPPYSITDCNHIDGLGSYFPVVGSSDWTDGRAFLTCGTTADFANFGSGGAPYAFPPGAGYWWGLMIQYSIRGIPSCPSGGGVYQATVEADYYMLASSSTGAAGTYSLGGNILFCIGYSTTPTGVPSTVTVS